MSNSLCVKNGRVISGTETNESDDSKCMVRKCESDGVSALRQLDSRVVGLQTIRLHTTNPHVGESVYAFANPKS